MKKTFVIIALMVLAGCATRGAVIVNGPGFFLGLWHGIISPFTFFVHIFVDGIAVYASPNNGGWYDFGFLIGVGAFSSRASSLTNEGK